MRFIAHVIFGSSGFLNLAAFYNAAMLSLRDPVLRISISRMFNCMYTAYTIIEIDSV